MACRFPGGSEDLERYWQLLERGGDAVRELPAERWPLDARLAAELPALRWAGLLERVDQFDAEFFGITPREAAELDPQQRLLLEVGWEALEDAQQPLQRLARQPAGVFVGISTADYQHGILELPAERLGAYSATGNMASVAAGRLAYTLGLQGPCTAVDTACSSSLVAVHLACQSLRSGESAVALAAGVNLILSPTWMRMVALTQSLSPDGRCKTFDARANGFVRGEGCGALVLKRLSDAQRDGDRVWAVLRGSSINHDGRSGGLTVPNVLSQQATLRKALEAAGVAAADIGYVEAHGTGTPLGDPIELEALKAVLGAPRPAGQGEATCRVGSVKTNLGHLEAAAGVAGLIKVVLSLAHQRLPAHLHFRALNPRVSLDGTALRVSGEAEPWPRGERPRRAIVSSFGISGTNAGVVVEEAPAREGAAEDAAEDAADAAAATSSATLLALSARSPEALRQLALRYAARLDEPGPAAALPLLAHAAGARRAHHPWRQAFPGASRAELAAALRAFAALPELPVREASQPPRVAMIFPGQGSQWLGMGQELAEREPVFRAALDEFDAAVREVAGWSVRDELFAAPAASRLDRVDVIQPCIVAVQVALAALWRSWGVEPAVVVGQSMGEVSAALVAGALSVRDAARVITARSELVRQLRGGGMASVELPAEALAGALEPGLDIAAINGPTSTLVAGEVGALDRLVAAMAERGVFCRKVKVDYASHSPQVEPLREPLLARLAEVRGQPPAIAFRSTVHGGWVGDELDAGYWYRNLREPVQLYPVLRELLCGGDGPRVDALLELSPHPILGPVLQAAAAAAVDSSSVAVLASLRREQPERPALLHTLAALYTRGQEVDFAAVCPRPSGAPHLALPAYPWQRQRHWLPTVAPRPVGATVGRAEDALPPGTRLRSPSLRAAVYEVTLDGASLRCFESHRVAGGVIAPASWMLAMIAAGLRGAGQAQPHQVRDLVFAQPLAIPDGAARRVQLVLGPEASAPQRVQLFCSQARGDGGDGAGGGSDDEWTLIAEGAIAPQVNAPASAPANATASAPASAPAEAPLDASFDAAARIAALTAVDEPALDELVGHPGAERWTTALYRGEREALLRLRPARPGDHLERFVLSPEPINEALLALGHIATGEGSLRLAPVALERFTSASREVAVWLHGTAAPAGDGGLRLSLRLYDEHGALVAELASLRCVAASLEQALTSARGLLAREAYQLRWRPLDGATSGAAAGERSGAATRAPDGAAHDSAAPERWLLASDDAALAAALARPGRELTALALAPVETLRQRAAAALAALPFQRVIFFAPEAAPDFAALRALYQLVPALAPGAAALCLVTRGAHAVVAGDAVRDPDAAAVWGLGRVLARELPELAPRMIDLEAAPSAPDLASQLARALAHREEDQLAVRGARCFALRLARRPAARGAVPPALAPEASYLVTGGLGRLGLAVVEWLVARGARHLLIVSRSRPSEAAAERLAALEERGARIALVRADVGDAAALEPALAAARAELPPLRGVIHAAGQARQALAVDEPWSEAREVLGAKAAGAWNLHRATAADALDFFVLFSSMSGVLGLGGMGSYAAANAALDALAAHRRALGLPALSISWGVWDRELEPALAERAGRAGLVPLAAEEGLRALGELLASEEAHVVVAPMRWDRHLRERGATPPWLSAFAAASSSAAAAAPAGAAPTGVLASLRGASRAVAAEQLAAHVAATVAETLGYPRHHALPRSKGFFQLGFDSLLAMDLRRRLGADLGQTLPATLVFDHPTIEQLAAALAERWEAERTKTAEAEAVDDRVCDRDSDSDPDSDPDSDSDPDGNFIISGY